MNKIRKAERKLSETAAYRYIFGAVWKLTELIKYGFKWLLRHIIGFLMTAAFIGMIIAAEAFDSGAVTYTAAILFIALLGAAFCVLLRIKISESRGGKK